MLQVIQALSCPHSSLITFSNRPTAKHAQEQHGGDGLQEEVRVFCPLEPLTTTNSIPDWSLPMSAQRRFAPAAPPATSQHPAATPPLSLQAQGTPVVVTHSGAAAAAKSTRYRTCLYWCNAIMRRHCACKSDVLLTGCSGHSTSQPSTKQVCDVCGHSSALCLLCIALSIAA